MYTHNFFFPPWTISTFPICFLMEEMPFLPISLDFSFLELIKAILLWRYKVLNQEVLGWCDNPCSPEFLWSCVSVPMVPVPVPFLWAFSVVTPLVWPLQCITGLINSMQGKKNIQPVALCFKLILMTKKRKKHLSNFLVVHVLQSMHGVLAFWLNFGTPLGFKKSQKYRVTCWTSHFWLFLVCLLQPWCAQSALQHYKTPSFTPFSMSVGTCVYSCHNRREPGLPSS